MPISPFRRGAALRGVVARTLDVSRLRESFSPLHRESHASGSAAWIAIITCPEVPQTTRREESTTADIVLCWKARKGCAPCWRTPMVNGSRRTRAPSEALPTVLRMWARQHTLFSCGAPNRRGLPRWCTRVAVLGLNRDVFGCGRLPLRHGPLHDAVLQLGGGVLRLDGRRERDGPRERPIVEFPSVVVLLFRGRVFLHFAFKRQCVIGHVDLEVFFADPRHLCLDDHCLGRLVDFNRRFHLT